MLRYAACLLQYYISPAGQRFRSRQEIMRHLESAAQQGKNVMHEEISPHLAGGSQSVAGGKEEQQRYGQPRDGAASDASQGQGEAASGQMPAAPLFVAQSPAGKGQADEWVKGYLATHPKESETEALRGTAASGPPPTPLPPPLPSCPPAT